jgi:23S rRNA pseudouridine2457 synthase
MSRYSYFIVYKPFRVLSQFSSTVEIDKLTLAAFFKVPPNVHPVGRLDYDSEGLLLLTNNKQIHFDLLHPNNQHNRTYWVQVEGTISKNAINEIQNGISITLKNGPYKTKPCKAKIIAPPNVQERNPPIRTRKHIPVSWAEITLQEGKNRQVRKMFAAVGYPVLRLIRFSIESIKLAELKSGEMKQVSEHTFLSKLNIS